MREWFKMSANADAAEILIYDVIGKSYWGEETVSAKDFNKQLNDLGQVNKITIRINSPGGDAFEGLAIYSTLKAHPAETTVRIDGIAASAASLIAMAAKNIVMPKNTFMLVHEPAGIVWGTSDDMKSMAADLDRLNDSFAETYADRSNQDPKAVKKLMKEDRLMTASEAVDLGYADSLVDDIKITAAFSPLFGSDVTRLAPSLNAFHAAVAAQGGDKKEGENTESDPAPAVTEPPENPETEPSPEPTNKNNVVNIDTARSESRKEALAYTREIMDICRLAGKTDMAADFIAKERPVAEVRKALIDLRADETDRNVSRGQHGADEKAVTSASWKKATEKVNKRRGLNT